MVLMWGFHAYMLEWEFSRWRFINATCTSWLRTRYTGTKTTLLETPARRIVSYRIHTYIHTMVQRQGRTKLSGAHCPIKASGPCGVGVETHVLGRYIPFCPRNMYVRASLLYIHTSRDGLYIHTYTCIIWFRVCI